MPVQRSDKGFVLIVTCIALTILMALAVLGIDIGRMRVIKSELQAFTDAAALNRREIDLAGDVRTMSETAEILTGHCVGRLRSRRRQSNRSSSTARIWR